MRVLVVIAVSAACGRIGFSAQDPDAAIPDGSIDPPPVVPATLVDMAGCQSSSFTLSLKDGAKAGDTLLVAFFMREPNPNTAPTISGAGLAWDTDIAFASALGTNRRTIALFRAQVAAAIAPGTPVIVDHPPAGATGGALFNVAAQVTPAGASTGEGAGPAFTGSLSTAGNGALCVVVHHNETGAMFEAPFERAYDFNVNCGETRNSAGIHIATAPIGGTVDCTGALGGSHTWVIAVLGYDNLAL